MIIAIALLLVGSFSCEVAVLLLLDMLLYWRVFGVCNMNTCVVGGHYVRAEFSIVDEDAENINGGRCCRLLRKEGSFW